MTLERYFRILRSLIVVALSFLVCGNVFGADATYTYYDYSGYIHTKEEIVDADEEESWIEGCLKRTIKHYYKDENSYYDPDADRNYGRTERIDVIEQGYLMFDSGNSAYIDCGNSSSFNHGNSFTLVARAKIGPDGGGYLISKSDGSHSQYGMAIAKDTGGLLFTYGDKNSPKQLDLNFSTEDWRDGEWHEFAITVREASPPSSVWVTGYVDGEAYRERNTRYSTRSFSFRRGGGSRYYGINTFSDVPVLIGARGDGFGGVTYALDGAISDVKIFDDTLSSLEISNLFSGESVNGLSSHWDLTGEEADIAEDLVGEDNGVIYNALTVKTEYYEEYVYYNESDPSDERVASMSVKDINTDDYLGGYENTYDAEGNLTERREYNADGEVVYLARYTASGIMIEERIAEERDVADPRQEEFISVANLAWSNYGYDLGKAVTVGEYGWHDGYSAQPERLRDKLSKWSEGGNYVRLFLFCDFRAGMEFADGTSAYQDEFGDPLPEGTPVGFFGTDASGEYTSTVYNDMAELLAAAEELDLKIIPTLFDYRIADGTEDDWCQEHRDVIEDADKREALIEIFRPFIEEFGDHPAVYAWDVMNEPEMACEGRYEGDPYNPVSFEGELGMKEFVKQFVKMIHEETETALVTVGSFEKGDMVDNWIEPDPSDSERDLDVFQFHYYDNMKQYHLDDHERLDNHILDLNELIDLQGKPVIAGELDPTDVQYKLDILANNGYDGGLFWDDVDNPLWTIDEDELAIINDWFFGTYKLYYEGTGNLRVMLTPCVDGVGSVYSRYTDENIGETGHGLLTDEVLARYDANGAKYYNYEYYTGTQQVRYKYMYHRGDYTTLVSSEFTVAVATSEYSTDGSLIETTYYCTRYIDTGHQRAEFFDGPSYDGWGNDYKYYLNEQWGTSHGREYIERNVNDNKVYKYAYREGTYDRIEKWEYTSVNITDPNSPVLEGFQIAWFWWDNENMRYKGKLLSEADGEGNIYYERYDENWNEWGHGRVSVTRLAEANGNGELSFEHAYHTGSEQEQYIYSYTDEDRENLYGTYEYDTGGTLIGFTPASGGASLDAGEIFQDEFTENEAITSLKASSHGEGIKIALLDSGEEWHGKATENIIAKAAPSSEVSSPKVLNNNVTTSDILSEAIGWALETGTRIISMSLTISSVSAPLKEAISDAFQRGVFIFASAGNGGEEIVPTSLAAQEGVITVGSFDARGTLSSWSNYGEEVDIYAPWCVPGLDGSLGTSFSTAYVTGLAALLLEDDPSMDRSELISRLKDILGPECTKAEAEAEAKIKGTSADEVLDKTSTIQENVSQFTGYGIEIESPVTLEE